MPRILVTEGFKFAVDGNQVIEVEPGEQDVSERCAEVAVEHLKVATLVGAAAAPVTPPAPVKPVARPAVKPSTKPATKANTGGK